MILNKPMTLLFIEPQNIKKINDINIIKYKWFKDLIDRKEIIGTYDDESNTFIKDCYYVGKHKCICGELSMEYDILLPNKMITNSLAYHYLCYHSDEILEMDLFKLAQLKDYIDMLFINY